MARARSIKPGFFENEVLGTGDPFEQLLFAGLWLLADREGRLENRPLRIKALVFPYRENLDVSRMIRNLSSNGFLALYVVNGVEYIQILNFSKHQSPHKNEKDSEIPEPTKESIKTNGCTSTEKIGTTPEEIGTTRASSLTPSSLTPSSLTADCGLLTDESIVRANALVERKAPDVIHPQAVSGVFDYWRAVMGHPHAKLDDKRRRKIRDRLKDGYPVGDLCKAIDGCRRSPHHMGENDSGTVYDDLELICRDGSHVDKFIKLAQQNPALLSLSPAGRKTVKAAQEWLEAENGTH